MNNNYPFCLISCLLHKYTDAAELSAFDSARNQKQINNKKKGGNLPTLC